MALSSKQILSPSRIPSETLRHGTEHRTRASCESSRQLTSFCAQPDVCRDHRYPSRKHSDSIAKKALRNLHPVLSAPQRQKCTVSRRDAVLFSSVSICCSLGAGFEGPAEAELGRTSANTVSVGGHDGSKLEISRLINGMWQVSG